MSIHTSAVLLFDTWDVISRKSSQIIRATDERWIPVFWQPVAMLDTSGERLPSSEQSRLLLYKKFSVFRYQPTTLPSNRALFLQMFEKIVQSSLFSITVSEILSSFSSLHNLWTHRFLLKSGVSRSSKPKITDIGSYSVQLFEDLTKGSGFLNHSVYITDLLTHRSPTYQHDCLCTPPAIATFFFHGRSGESETVHSQSLHSVCGIAYQQK